MSHKNFFCGHTILQFRYSISEQNRLKTQINRNEVSIMTLLNCSATSCTYNRNQKCSRGDIEVSGSDAHRSDETCCASFLDRRYDNTHSNVNEGCGCEKIEITCQAQSCTYNDACRCTASAINISGAQASTEKETQCSTFHCSSCR